MLYLQRMYPKIIFFKLFIIVSMLSCNKPVGKLVAIQPCLVILQVRD